MQDYQKRFINRYAPVALQEWERGGALPSLTLTQALTESRWGLSHFAAKTNSLFQTPAGSGWRGASCRFAGKTFRVYDSPEASVRDRTDALRLEPEYKNAVYERDYRNACRFLSRAGYFSSVFAQALINTIEKYRLYQYDSAKASTKRE
ncbi:MAG: glucosaminidase domain-containing protein [Oscillospiraceae bacterium]|jgi:flagellum-specific peptidoglycan hydrolase FlgJ|nr:glucosaminidase domain-containing protein [Oscillospiraceae bacterium]